MAYTINNNSLFYNTLFKMTAQQLNRMFDEVAKEFNSSGKALNEDVLRLQEWLETQPHLPKLLGEHPLRNFLILNKGSMEITKQKIDNYYSFRAKLPEVAYEMNPKLPQMKEFNKLVYLVDHPQLTNEMYKLTFFKIKVDPVPNDGNPILFVRKLVAMMELKLRYDVMCGDIFVIDCKGLPLNVLLKITPMFVYKLMVLLYDGVISSRLKACHMLNVATPVSKIIKVVKSVMKPKLGERIYVHAEESDLKKCIPLNLLPVDFGGEGLSLQELEDALEVKFAENQDLFDRLDEIKVDETLRPEKLKGDYNLGFYGSFKNIDFD